MSVCQRPGGAAPGTCVPCLERGRCRYESTADLTQHDRLWLGAHGDERFADEWAALQRREDMAAQIERTKVKRREFDEAGISYNAIMLSGYADPIDVRPT